MTRERWRAHASTLARARQLRRQMTPPEQKLRQRLRARQLNGAHFRKQHPMGPFVVDFLCARSKLVIEIDGDTHACRAGYDAARAQRLKEQKNYRVIRFSNSEVNHNLEGVLERIAEALTAAS